MDERQRIDRVLKGDTSAFSYFVDTYQDMAIAIALRVCGNRDDAEDIAQNAFVKAYRHLDTFRAGSKFSTWFYRIVYNTAISEVRTGNNAVHQPLSYDETAAYTARSSDPDPATRLEAAEQTADIERALAALTETDRVAITLFYLDDRSIRDIAAIVGLTESNVRVRLHRARKQLASLLNRNVTM